MIYFFSYGDNNYSESKIRIKNEAIQMGFDKVDIYGPENLPYDFVSNSMPYISHKRGAGYWIWKSFFLKKTFDSMDDGDVCIYADAGCHVNKFGKKRLKEN